MTGISAVPSLIIYAFINDTTELNKFFASIESIIIITIILIALILALVLAANFNKKYKEELKTYTKKKSTQIRVLSLFPILIVLLSLLEIPYNAYKQKEYEEKYKVTESTTTTESTTSTTENSNSYDIKTTKQPLPIEVDKEEEYTLKLSNNKEKKFTFRYAYQEDYKFNNKYNYILYIESTDDTVDPSFGIFITGTGNTKEEAKKMKENSNIKYDTSLIHVLSDITNVGTDYLLFLVPSLETNGEKIGYIANPIINYPNGNMMTSLNSGYTLNGYLLPTNSKFGFTKEYIESTYATVRVEDNAIYYIRDNSPTKNSDKIDVIKAYFQNQKIQTIRAGQEEGYTQIQK